MTTMLRVRSTNTYEIPTCGLLRGSFLFSSTSPPLAGVGIAPHPRLPPLIQRRTTTTDEVFDSSLAPVLDVSDAASQVPRLDPEADRGLTGELCSATAPGDTWE